MKLKVVDSISCIFRNAFVGELYVLRLIEQGLCLTLLRCLALHFVRMVFLSLLELENFRGHSDGRFKHVQHKLFNKKTDKIITYTKLLLTYTLAGLHILVNQIVFSYFLSAIIAHNIR